jgi:hypothetical protein
MNYREFYHRHLPHWQPLNATMFITFRLAGSLPKVIVEELRRERVRAKKALEKITNPEDRISQNYHDERLFLGLWDKALDNDTESPKWLIQSEIAEIIHNALHYRDQKVYKLHAFCIMPNHVHLVCTPLSVSPKGNNTRDELTNVGRIVNPPYILHKYYNH